MFTELITPATLEKLAGKAAFLRGRDYFALGAVGPLRITETRISA